MSNNVLTKEQKWGDAYLKMLKEKQTLLSVADFSGVSQNTVEIRIIKYLDILDDVRKGEEYDFMFSVPNTCYFDIAKNILMTRIPLNKFYKINKIPQRTIEVANEILKVDCSYLNEAREQIEKSKKSTNNKCAINRFFIGTPHSCGEILGKWSY